MFGIKTRIGLRAKFITGITILVVLIDIAFSLFFIRRQREFIHLNLKERGLALAANLAYNSEYGVLTANSNILNNLIAGVIKQPDVEYCIVRNIEGEILAAQGLKGELETAINKLKSIETDEPTVKLWDGEADQKYYIIRAPVASRIIDSFRYETGLFLEEEDWIEESKKEKEPAELAGEEVLFEGEKPGSEEKIGAVIIGISLTNAARLIRETGRTAFLIAIFILLISFVITIFLSKILIDPIKKLSAGTDRIAGGDLDFKVRIESGDEIGQLADSFNKMIVDLKRYQDELIEAKEYAGNIIESMIDTLIIVDPEGKIASMNKATTDLLGYEEEEILGRPISELFTEEDRKVLDLKGGENENPGDRSNIFRNVEKTYLAKDGRRIPVLFSSSQIRDKKSMLTGIVCVTRDITKRKEAEELAEERRVAMEDRIRKSERSRKAMLYMVEDLNRTSRELKTTQSQLVRSERLAAIGELAGGVAHELRNSLGVLTNAAAYLKLALPDADETVRKNLNHMKENVARANKVITDLLDFTRESKPAWTVFSLCAAADGIFKEIEIPENIKVTRQWPEKDPPRVFADQDHIYHIIFNLIKNAVEAMTGPEKKGKEGRLTLDCRKNGKGEVVFTVSDTGIGIPPENLEKIFDPLYTGKATGIGLGLSLSQRYVELNGGRIAVESEVGVGSTFTLTLPGNTQIHTGNTQIHTDRNTDEHRSPGHENRN